MMGSSSQSARHDTWKCRRADHACCRRPSGPHPSAEASEDFLSSPSLSAPLQKPHVAAEAIMAECRDVARCERVSHAQGKETSRQTPHSFIASVSSHPIIHPARLVPCKTGQTRQQQPRLLLSSARPYQPRSGYLASSNCAGFLRLQECTRAWHPPGIGNARVSGMDYVVYHIPDHVANVATVAHSH